jgi:hypothetical protein
MAITKKHPNIGKLKLFNYLVYIKLGIGFGFKKLGIGFGLNKLGIGFSIEY